MQKNRMQRLNMRQKNGRWYAQWMEYSFDDSGKMTARQITRAAGPDKKAAIALERQQKAYWEKIKLGQVPPVTFEQIMLAYLKTQTQTPAFNSKKSNAKHLRRFFAGKQIAELTAADIKQYTTRRQTIEHAGASTINKEIQLLSAAIKHANAINKWQLTNPCTGQRLKPPPSRVRWLTAEEKSRLIEAATGNPRAPLLRQWVILAINTGMRYREITELEWSKIDQDNNLIILKPTHNKTRINHAIPLNHNARQAIAEIQQFHRQHGITSPSLFTDTHGTPLLTIGKRSFKTALKKAGLDDLTQRDLRHVAASAMIQAGATLQEVQAVLGHADISTTQIYAHLAPNAARSAVERLDNRENLGKDKTDD